MTADAAVDAGADAGADAAAAFDYDYYFLEAGYWMDWMLAILEVCF